MPADLFPLFKPSKSVSMGEIDTGCVRKGRKQRERIASKELLKAFKEQFDTSRRLRDSTNNDLFFDLLGIWVPAKLNHEQECLHVSGTVEFWADNRMSAKLTSRTGTCEVDDFEGTAWWTASTNSEGKTEVHAMWSSNFDLHTDDGCEKIGDTFPYSPEKGILTLVVSSFGDRPRMNRTFTRKAVGLQNPD
ncbi:hypothetical protein AB1Y20_006956 [Prymnesium parvum]|uniref:Uncharacterized protein n=1 Tax=Prymnesium parvum TaxID=97485 RepID=A0AB34IZ14_PRYPA